MEQEIVFQLLYIFHVQLVMNQMDKEDVFQKFQLVILHLHHLQHQNVHLVRLQMDKEDVYQLQLNLQLHVLLDIWVMDKEIVFLYQHQFQLFQQILQVPAHAKVLLMNYKLKLMLW